MDAIIQEKSLNMIEFIEYQAEIQRKYIQKEISAEDAMGLTGKMFIRLQLNLEEINSRKN
ncbi:MULTISPECIES: hypothetical protein [Bacillus cereus group]|uniref:Uncharacterized protein n=1 Tax=Bacillus cereus TaxID=1396 RepID=A0A9X6ZHG7_BACCE|nr:MULTISPECIES: hypothetical protein [Bacillus cereus group]PFF51718.1 hypothetical protein CN357_03200 [Bacillus cereus]PGB07045.1 hypothetical protein COM09_31445 [Bacillus toyonensis]